MEDSRKTGAERAEKVENTLGRSLLAEGGERVGTCLDVETRDFFPYREVERDSFGVAWEGMVAFRP